MRGGGLTIPAAMTASTSRRWLFCRQMLTACAMPSGVCGTGTLAASEWYPECPWPDEEAARLAGLEWFPREPLDVFRLGGRCSYARCS